MELDPNAIIHIDKRAAEIVLLFKEISLPTFSLEKTGFPQPFTEGEITEKDIVGEVKISLVNAIGEDEFLYFLDKEKKPQGIRDERLRQFRKFIEQIEKACKYKVSTDYLTSLLLEYCKSEHNSPNHTVNFSKVLLERLAVDIRDYTIILPISNLSVEIEITLGEVKIVPLSQAEIESWFKPAHNDDSEAKKLLRKSQIEEVQKEHQGGAAAKVNIVAESKAANREAREKVEKALALLRLYCSANFHPEVASYVNIWGTSKIPEFKTFFYREDSGIQIQAGILKNTEIFWRISGEMLIQMNQDGLGRIVQIHQKQNKSEFEKLLLETIWLYSQSNLKANTYEKLLYMLAALEKLLIKDSSEPLQQNISERLAFLIAPTLESRKAVIENLKKIYAIRSSFFHHGKKIENTDSMIIFMQNIWSLLMNLINQSDKFISKESLLSLVEDKKLS